MGKAKRLMINEKRQTWVGGREKLRDNVTN